MQSEIRLARAQQVTHMGSWELDFATNVLLLSDEACRIYGLPPGQNLQTFESWLLFTHPEESDFVSRKVTESRDTMVNFSFYHRIVHMDGFIRYIYSECGFEFDANGKPTILYGIAHDVTEKRLAEEQLEFDKNNLASLINNTNDLMWSVDRDFKLITSNQSFDNLAALISGRSIARGSNVLSPGFSHDQLKRFKKFYERAFAGETFTEVEHVDIPTESWSEISFSPIRKGNEVIGSACYSHDITGRKLAELERIKITNDLIQRNKDLEQFSYIVSHNLRAPVANIIGLSAAVQDKTLGTDIQQELMEGLSHSAKKLDDVIVDLNNILQTKQEVSQKMEVVYFSKIANDIHSSIENLIEKEEALLLWDFSEADKMITLKSYLHSIFYNLISNSLKYRRPNIPPVIEIKSSKPKNKIELLFKDNGMGIDLEKTGHQVFGLYKRFHAQSTEGRGMGLYMVKTQVEAIGGKISISSEVNKGTEFKIEFAT